MFTEEDIVYVEREDRMMWILKTDEASPKDAFVGDGGNLFYADPDLDSHNEQLADFLNRPGETTTIDSFTLYEYDGDLYTVWNY